jgi:hypothetical protein
MYQGLALPNFPLVALAKKITFLLSNWGFPGVAHSNSLAMAYDNFFMEVDYMAALSAGAMMTTAN